jgi:hypothetical protein
MPNTNNLRNWLDFRAHRADIIAAPGQHLAGRYWMESVNVLQNIYKYPGSIPNTYGVGQLWFNIF